MRNLIRTLFVGLMIILTGCQGGNQNRVNISEFELNKRGEPKEINGFIM